MSYDSQITALSPTGWWKLSDSAAPFADSSGNGNNMTVGSGTVTAGQTPIAAGLGNCIKIGTTSTWLSATNGLSGTPTALTAIIWAQMVSTPAAAGVLLDALASTTTGKYFDYCIANSTGFKWRLETVWTSGGGSKFSTAVAGTSTAMLAMTWSGTTMTPYVNGTSLGTVTTTGSPAVGTTYLGHHDSSIQSAGLVCYASELAIFSTALSSTNISNLYTAGTTAASTSAPNPTPRLVVPQFRASYY